MGSRVIHEISYNKGVYTTILISTVVTVETVRSEPWGPSGRTHVSLSTLLQGQENRTPVVDGDDAGSSSYFSTLSEPGRM